MNNLKHFIRLSLDASVSRMIKIGITPNLIKTISFELNLFSAVLFCIAAFLERETAMELIGLGGGGMLLAYLLVMIYQEAIQKENIDNRFSTVYTSVLGCYSELFILFGIFFCLMFHGYFIASIFSFVALTGSMMDGFVHEIIKGSGMNLEKRPIKPLTRNFIISVGAIMCSWFKESMSFDGMILWVIPVAVIAILSHIGVVIYLYHCRKSQSENKGEFSQCIIHKTSNLK